MAPPETPRRVVVLGADGEAVGREVARRREAGERAAGFVGGEGDEETARTMGREVLGEVDEVVVLGAAGGPRPGPA